MKTIRLLTIILFVTVIALPASAQSPWSLGLKANSLHLRLSDDWHFLGSSPSKAPVNAYGLMLETRYTLRRTSLMIAGGTGLTGIGEGPLLQFELGGAYTLGTPKRMVPFVQAGVMATAFDSGDSRETVYGIGPTVGAGLHLPVSSGGNIRIGLDFGKTNYRSSVMVNPSMPPPDPSVAPRVRLDQTSAWQLRPFVTVSGAIKRD